ncbi:hypothetical protein AK812_SmicGene25033 [Symbiodinium microadriaticum]|uniref:Uncharacterized protein n=1 Tax=Symbiodinium microadriaticum TaxID=2951 RepID=A0A1Q9DD23_SYMMI|nr:hypothetical protein AK812_SmicGene25033 [Symbiodinium microadriaticum]
MVGTDGCDSGLPEAAEGRALCPLAPLWRGQVLDDALRFFLPAPNLSDDVDMAKMNTQMRSQWKPNLAVLVQVSDRQHDQARLCNKRGVQLEAVWDESRSLFVLFEGEVSRAGGVLQPREF